MKRITRERKNTKRLLSEVAGVEWLKEQMVTIMTQGKRAFDECALKVGRMLVETILHMDREAAAGPDYHPNDPSLRKGPPARFGLHRRTQGESRASPASRA